MAADYTELDAAILERLARGPGHFWGLSVALLYITAPMARAQQRHVDCWRFIDRRLQALRKRGLIEYSRGLWRLVPKAGA